MTRSATTVCVGLDPDLAKLPNHLSRDVNGLSSFLKGIIDATADLACAYKPNFAFFGALGPEGLSALGEVMAHVPGDIPVILDFKAGDIGNTAEKYAKMAYDLLGADAVTVNPYMGYDAVEPFLRGTDKCVFLLCLTSNTLVVGATHPEDLPKVRKLARDLPFLIPGVGSQGGNPSKIAEQASSADGFGILVNASRSILYASPGEDYAEAARQATDDLRVSLQST